MEVKGFWEWRRRKQVKIRWFVMEERWEQEWGDYVTDEERG